MFPSSPVNLRILAVRTERGQTSFDVKPHFARNMERLGALSAYRGLNQERVCRIMVDVTRLVCGMGRFLLCFLSDSRDTRPSLGPAPSKWARALRYVARSKVAPAQLKVFMKEVGGVNACADRYATYFGRRAR